VTQVPPGRPFLGARPTTDAVPAVVGVPVLFLAILALAVWGRHHGAVLGSPVLLATLVVLFAASGSEWYQRLLGGGHLHNRVVLRLAHATVLIGVVLLVAGWGFLLPAAVVLIGVLHIGWSGSRTWRPATAVTVAVTIAMEIAVQFGAPSVVPAAHSHLAATINLLLAGFGLSNLGLAAARAEEATLTLQRAEERFRALVQDSTDVVAVIDTGGRLTHVSDAARHVSGWDPGDLQNTPYVDLFHPDDQQEFGAALTAVTGGGSDTQARVELRVAHRDGTWHWHEVTLRNALDHPAVGGIVSNQRDISDRRAQQDRLAHAAAHDPLTGLPNRAEVLRPRRRRRVAGGRRGTAARRAAGRGPAGPARRGRVRRRADRHHRRPGGTGAGRAAHGGHAAALRPAGTPGAHRGEHRRRRRGPGHRRGRSDGCRRHPDVRGQTRTQRAGAGLRSGSGGPAPNVRPRPGARCAPAGTR
jgi:PAS domain S-box-containing protein